MLFSVSHFELHHIGVGFCVARSTEMGNAKASKCGTSDNKNPTLFCIQIIKFEFGTLTLKAKNRPD